MRESGIYQMYLKNLLDRLLALVGTAALSWLLILLGIAIHLDSPGPIFFRQKRAGKNGTYFYIYKFRTMRIDTPHDMPTHMLNNPDLFITRVGRFLRKTSLDELPQLFNIIKGEMSFIGPRPERPEIIDQYMEEIPEFAFRMRVKAGLAGYAQVYGKYNTTPYDKLKLDLTYIENYSVGLDFKLLLLTMKIVLKPESTEGVDASQITAMKQEEKKEDES